MINLSFPFFILLILYMIITIAFHLFIRKFTLRSWFVMTIFALYIIIVLCIVFFPLPYQRELIQDSIRNHWSAPNNYIPFKGWIDAFKDIKRIGFFSAFYQLIMNMALFFPFGFYIPILKNKVGIGRVIEIAFIFSGIIESIQVVINLFFGFNYRSFDVDDIICNVTGTILGYVIYKWVKKYFVDKKVWIN